MNKRIFVVDDDWNRQLCLQEFLKGEGYEVDTTSDELMAQKKLDDLRKTYDVILLDLTMSRMDGLEFIQALRQQGEALTFTIIVLSGDREAIDLAIRMGIRYFLAKPFDLESLLALVSHGIPETKLLSRKEADPCQENH